MRHHFHRCRYLRVLTMNASDLSGPWKGGGPVLEELCEAKGLASCIGVVDCDVLALAEKRELLARRVVRAAIEPEDEEADRLFEGTSDARARELCEVRESLLEEREQIVEENRRLMAEFTAGLDAHGEANPSEETELPSDAISVHLDDQVRAFRAARLDAIDRALEELARGHYGECVRCGAPIAASRLRSAPDTLVCWECARDAEPEQVESEVIRRGPRTGHPEMDERVV